MPRRRSWRPRRRLCASSTLSRSRKTNPPQQTRWALPSAGEPPAKNARAATGRAPYDPAARRANAGGRWNHRLRGVRQPLMSATVEDCGGSAPRSRCGVIEGSSLIRAIFSGGPRRSRRCGYRGPAGREWTCGPCRHHRAPLWCLIAHHPAYAAVRLWARRRGSADRGGGAATVALACGDKVLKKILAGMSWIDLTQSSYGLERGSALPERTARGVPMIRSLLSGLGGGWLRDFARGWLIKCSVRELRQAGGGCVIEVRGSSRLEVHVPPAHSRPPRAATHRVGGPTRQLGVACCPATRRTRTGPCR
jgi:hypothetical protein